MNNSNLGPAQLDSSVAYTPSPLPPTQSLPEPVEELKNYYSAEFKETLAAEVPVTNNTAVVQEAIQKIENAVDQLTDGPVTQAQFADLKSQINDSFEEIASVLLEQSQNYLQLMERIDVYNRRSSHKI